MRFSRIASAVPVCIGAALLATRALALPPISPLLEGDFLADSSDDVGNNFCIMGVDSGNFSAYSSVHGPGTGGEDVSVAVNAAQPTSTSRGTDKLSVKQSQFAMLTVYFNAVVGVTDLPIEKCSMNGTFTKHNAHEAVSARCKGDDLSALFSTDQITSLKTAMQRKHIKLTVDKAHAKWSLSIDCNGTWFPHG
jgi:hypothetical protein